MKSISAEQYDLFASISENAYVAIYAKDTQGRYILFNKEASRIFGKQSEDVLGKDDYGIFPAQQAEKIIADDRIVLASGRLVTSEDEITTVDGQAVYLTTKGPTFDENGNVTGLFGISRNITEHKKMVVMLKENTERFSATQKLAHIGVWAVNLESEAVTWTEELYLIAGLDPSLPAPSFENLQNLYSPASWELLMNGIQRTRDSGEAHQLELVLVRPDGTERNVSVFGGAKYDDAGNIVGLFGTVQDNTEKKQTEKALEESERRYKELFDACPDGISLIGKDGRIKRANNRQMEMFGYDTSGAMIGAMVTEMIEPSFRDKAMQNMRCRLNGDEIPPVEYLFLRKDGTTFYGELSATIMRNPDNTVSGYLCVTHDVTAQKKAAEALRSSEELFRQFLEHSPYFVYIKDENMRLVKISKNMEKLCGKPVSELLGKDAYDRLPPELAKLEIDDEKNLIRDGVEVTREEHFKGKTYATTKFPIHREGNKGDYLAGFSIDITERKRTEAALANVQKLESLGLLAGGIAHDFNNLMGGIYGYIDMACEETQESKVVSYLSKAMSTIDRTRALTQQLLTFAKGGAPIQKVGALFPFVQETAHFALSGANVSCRFDVPDDLWTCSFDKNQIGQVIDNLIINAQQAMPIGGTIELTARNVSLAESEHPLLSKGDFVKISVKDTGIGIPPDMTAKIFDPFFTTKAMGHGLGLATCYSIINRHGGCIDVESVQGKGSTFTVYLPASIESVSASIGTISRTHEGCGTFLVMDDEQVMRDTISDMLESLGYSVVCKEDGKSAVDFFASETGASRKMCGLVFDLTVPGGMGGKAAIDEIRKLDKVVPAFVASGYADDPVMKTPAAFGFTASICKPFRKSELSEILNRYLG